MAFLGPVLGGSPGVAPMPPSLKLYSKNPIGKPSQGIIIIIAVVAVVAVVAIVIIVIVIIIIIIIIIIIMVEEWENKEEWVSHTYYIIVYPMYIVCCKYISYKMEI